MRATPETIRALYDKYSELRRLRVAHAAGAPIASRAALLALSQRFPGALRELDRLPLEIIEARLSALGAALHEGQPLPPWAPLQISYHGVLRAALRIKRRYSRHAEACNVLAELGSHYQSAGDEPALESLDLKALEGILRPRGGRLNLWVFAQVAALHGVDPAHVRQALFLR